MSLKIFQTQFPHNQLKFRLHSCNFIKTRPISRNFYYSHTDRYCERLFRELQGLNSEGTRTNVEFSNTYTLSNSESARARNGNSNRARRRLVHTTLHNPKWLGYLESWAASWAVPCRTLWLDITNINRIRIRLKRLSRNRCHSNDRLNDYRRQDPG